MTQLLARSSKLFAPLVEYQPTFVNGFNWLTTRDLHSKRIMKDSFQFDPSQILGARALLPGEKPNGVDHSLYLAFPFTIPEALVDQNGILSAGALNSITDVITSLHIIEALLPEPLGHVSVTLQSCSMNDIRAGDKIVALSAVDKIGKRFVYTSVTYLIDNGADGNSTEPEITTIKEFSNALQVHPSAATAKHLKCIVSMDLS